MNMTQHMLTLSVAERIQLVEDLWDSIALQPDNIPLPESQRQELKRRLQLHRSEPDSALTWEEVKASLKS